MKSSALKRIACLWCLVICATPVVGRARAQAPAPLAAVVQSIVDKHIAPGVVVLVANKERVLAIETAGYASLANKTPMRADAVFWIASMSKSLTGTALMMLVDEGKVSLDDPVEKYLPEFKGPDGPGRRPARASAQASDHRARDHGPHQRPGARQRQDVETHAVAQGRRRRVCRASAAAGAGHQIRIQQLRHQYRRAHHRSRQRHGLCRIHAAAAVRSAGHEGYHLLAERRTSRAAGAHRAFHRGQERSGRNQPGQGREAPT